MTRHASREAPSNSTAGYSCATSRSRGHRCACRTPSLARSVLVLEDEIRTADGAGQLRLLPCELEFRRKLLRDLHPVRELEPDGPFSSVIDGVQHVDRQATLVEDVRPADVLNLEGSGLERTRRDDDVTLLLEDLVHPPDGLLGL